MQANLHIGTIHTVTIHKDFEALLASRIVASFKGTANFALNQRAGICVVVHITYQQVSIVSNSQVENPDAVATVDG